MHTLRWRESEEWIFSVLSPSPALTFNPCRIFKPSESSPASSPPPSPAFSSNPTVKYKVWLSVAPSSIQFKYPIQVFSSSIQFKYPVRESSQAYSQAFCGSIKYLVVVPAHAKLSRCSVHRRFLSVMDPLEAATCSGVGVFEAFHPLRGSNPLRSRAKCYQRGYAGLLNTRYVL